MPWLLAILPAFAATDQLEASAGYRLSGNSSDPVQNLQVDLQWTHSADFGDLDTRLMVLPIGGQGFGDMSLAGSVTYLHPLPAGDHAVFYPGVGLSRGPMDFRCGSCWVEQLSANPQVALALGSGEWGLTATLGVGIPILGASGVVRPIGAIRVRHQQGAFVELETGRLQDVDALRVGWKWTL